MSAIYVRSAAANDANVPLEEWCLKVGRGPQTSEILSRGLSSTDALPRPKEIQYLILIVTYLSRGRVAMFVAETWVDLDKPLESPENDIFLAERVRRLRKRSKGYSKKG